MAYRTQSTSHAVSTTESISHSFFLREVVEGYINPQTPSARRLDLLPFLQFIQEIPPDKRLKDELTR
jgi:hypothetical protein